MIAGVLTDNQNQRNEKVITEAFSTWQLSSLDNITRLRTRGRITMLINFLS